MSSSSPSPAKPADNDRQSKSRSRSSSPTKKAVIETRRAEQNRAAQRAFRQRKELYIKDLEAKAKLMADWAARIEHLEKENEELKRKIAQLEHGDGDSNNNRKAVKLAYPNNKTAFTSSLPSSPAETLSIASLTTSSSSLLPSNKKSTISEQQQNEQKQSPQQLPKPVGEKGKVLDDLVSILKTRNRPPIQYHQYKPPKKL